MIPRRELAISPTISRFLGLSDVNKQNILHGSNLHHDVMCVP